MMLLIGLSTDPNMILKFNAAFFIARLMDSFMHASFFPLHIFYVASLSTCNMATLHMRDVCHSLR